jgi:hypothetical protein
VDSLSITIRGAVGPVTRLDIDTDFDISADKSGLVSAHLLDTWKVRSSSGSKQGLSTSTRQGKLHTEALSLIDAVKGSGLLNDAVRVGMNEYFPWHDNRKVSLTFDPTVDSPPYSKQLFAEDITAEQQKVLDRVAAFAEAHATKHTKKA